MGTWSGGVTRTNQVRKVGGKMAGESGTLPFVELLGVDAGLLTNAEQTVVTPVVFLALRPEPHRSFRSISLPVTLEQAVRLRDDLTRALAQFEPAAQLN